MCALQLRNSWCGSVKIANCLFTVRHLHNVANRLLGYVCESVCERVVIPGRLKYMVRICNCNCNFDFSMSIAISEYQPLFTLTDISLVSNVHAAGAVYKTSKLRIIRTSRMYPNFFFYF